MNFKLNFSLLVSPKPTQLFLWTFALISSSHFVLFLKHFGEVKLNPSPFSYTLKKTIIFLVSFALVTEIYVGDMCKTQFIIDNFVWNCHLSSRLLSLLLSLYQRTGWRLSETEGFSYVESWTDSIYESKVVFHSFDTTLLVNNFISFAVTSYKFRIFIDTIIRLKHYKNIQE
jgi:hypothetical protein